MTFRTLCLLILAVAIPATSIRAESPPADGVAFFENRIRPVLVKHCYECHAADSEEVGGKLLLDSRDGILSGGESGPALVAKNPDDSLILQALRWEDLQMPPDEPLPEQVVNDFVTWIKLGAPDPRTHEATPTSDPVTKEKAEPSLWSLQPRTKPPLPDVKDADWSRDPLDRFVLSKIEAAGLKPTDDADSRTLVRRLHYDLTGLLPSIDEVEQFVDAHSRNREQAVEQLVDALLGPPRTADEPQFHGLGVLVLLPFVVVEGMLSRRYHGVSTSHLVLQIVSQHFIRLQQLWMSVVRGP